MFIQPALMSAVFVSVSFLVLKFAPLLIAVFIGKFARKRTLFTKFLIFVNKLFKIFIKCSLLDAAHNY